MKQYKKNMKKSIGVIAGNFDVIHPGYIHLFTECKKHCDHLIVLLHTDPTIERPTKCKPILSVFDRCMILNSLIQVDEVKTYTKINRFYLSRMPRCDADSDDHIKRDHGVPLLFGPERRAGGNSTFSRTGRRCDLRGLACPKRGG